MEEGYFLLLFAIIGLHRKQMLKRLNIHPRPRPKPKQLRITFKESAKQVWRFDPPGERRSVVYEPD